MMKMYYMKSIYFNCIIIIIIMILFLYSAVKKDKLKE